MTKDALRIKLRKRINPNHQDHQDIQNFYPENLGNKFFSLGHFTDIFIDRVSNDFYMKKNPSDFPPTGSIKQSDKNFYSLKDLILPSSNRLSFQTNYEVQYLYLSYSVGSYINHQNIHQINSKNIEDLTNKEFQCILISGFKFSKTSIK